MADYWYPTAFSHWGNEEHEAIGHVLMSKRLTMGEQVEAFESEFAEYHNSKHAIMVNSGSSANLVAVAALAHKKDNPLERGEKCLVPAVAWATTYSPLVQHGLDLTLIDSDNTWGAANDKDLSRNIFGVKLIVGVPILGDPGHMDKWRKMANGIGAYFLVDCCESIGASVTLDIHHPIDPKSRRYSGTMGLLNTFSFFYSHQLSAIEGGMILSDDDELAHLCRLLRNHGNAGFTKKEKTFDEEYDFQLFGYNLRPLEMHAAIAREQLKKLEGFRKQREQNINNFATWTNGLPLGIQGITPGGWRNPFGVPFLLKDTETRARVAKALRENGIDCRLPTGGSFRKHAYGKPWQNAITPNADRIHETGIFLGNAPFPIDEQLHKAAKVLWSVLA